MNNSKLTASSATGNQSATSSPQQSSNPNAVPTNASSVQTGTANSLLTNNKSGVSLGGSAPTVVSIGPRTVAVTQKAQIAKDPPSAGALLIAFVLFAMAGIMLYNIIKAGKKTTE